MELREVLRSVLIDDPDLQPCLFECGGEAAKYSSRFRGALPRPTQATMDGDRRSSGTAVNRAVSIPLCTT